MARRGPYVTGLARRGEILDAAFALFVENGYDRTSVREVARAVGLTQTGLLHHFSSKEELFTEVLRRRDQVSKIESAHQPEGRPRTVEGLIAVMRDNATQPGLVRLYVRMSAEGTAEDSPARAFFEERYRDMAADMAADVRRHQADGRIDPDIDADAVAGVILAAADGLQVQWLLEPEATDMGEGLELLWRSFHREA